MMARQAARGPSPAARVTVMVMMRQAARGRGRHGERTRTRVPCGQPGRALCAGRAAPWTARGARSLLLALRGRLPRAQRVQAGQALRIQAPARERAAHAHVPRERAHVHF